MGYLLTIARNLYLESLRRGKRRSDFPAELADPAPHPEQAVAQFLVPLIALVVWRPVLDDAPGLVGVFLLNAGFSVMFTISGLLFRAAAEKGPTI